MIAPYFTSKMNELIQICEQLKINEMYFFGSSINGKFIPGKSDLDILVDTDDHDMKNVVRLSLALKHLFGCPIDVFHKKWERHQALNEYLKENKILIYKRAEKLPPALHQSL